MLPLRLNRLALWNPDVVDHCNRTRSFATKTYAHGSAALADLTAARNVVVDCINEGIDLDDYSFALDFGGELGSIDLLSYWFREDEDPSTPFEWHYLNCWQAFLDGPQAFLQSLSASGPIDQRRNASALILRRQLLALIRLLSRAITDRLRLGIGPSLRTAFQLAIRWHLTHGCHPPDARPQFPHLFSPGCA